MTLPLKYQLQENLIKQIREDERNKVIKELKEILDLFVDDEPYNGRIVKFEIINRIK